MSRSACVKLVSPFQLNCFQNTSLLNFLKLCSTLYQPAPPPPPKKIMVSTFVNKVIDHKAGNLNFKILHQFQRTKSKGVEILVLYQKYVSQDFTICRFVPRQTVPGAGRLGSVPVWRAGAR